MKTALLLVACAFASQEMHRRPGMAELRAIAQRKQLQEYAKGKLTKIHAKFKILKGMKLSLPAKMEVNKALQEEVGRIRDEYVMQAKSI